MATDETTMPSLDLDLRFEGINKNECSGPSNNITIPGAREGGDQDDLLMSVAYPNDIKDNGSSSIDMEESRHELVFKGTQHSQVDLTSDGLSPSNITKASGQQLELLENSAELKLSDKLQTPSISVITWPISGLASDLTSHNEDFPTDIAMRVLVGKNKDTCEVGIIEQKDDDDLGSDLSFNHQEEQVTVGCLKTNKSQILERDTTAPGHELSSCKSTYGRHPDKKRILSSITVKCAKKKPVYQTSVKSDGDQNTDFDTGNQWKITCHVCEKRFESPVALASHHKTFHSHAGKDKMCNKCFQSFRSARAFAHHCKSCQKGQLLNITIPKAKKSIIRKADTTCQICGIKYKQDHLTKPVLSKKPVICPNCVQTNGEIRTTHNKTVQSKDDAHACLKSYYQCSRCSKVFVLQASLDKHITAHHNKKANYRCHECGKPFITKGWLDTHVAKVHEHKEFKCDECDLVFVVEGKLKEHRNIHTGAKPFHCSTCGKAFRGSHLLSLHIRRTHKKKSISCSVCHKHLHGNHSLKLHMRIHTKERPFTCEHCGKDFIRNAALREHLKVHLGKFPFQCKECGKKFAGISALKTHKKLHLGNKYECPQCEMNFLKESTLQEHQTLCEASPWLHKKSVNSDELRHQCTKCGKKCNSKTKLETHMISHVDAQPYSCELCGKSFKYKSTIHTHLRVCPKNQESHSPYSCEWCGRKFSKQGHLDNHVRIHTGEKPYSCKECSRNFAHSGTLSQHKCEAVHKGSSKLVSVAVVEESARRESENNKPVLKETDNGGNLLSLPVTFNTETQSKDSAVGTGSELYACGTCDLKFAHKNSIAKHWMTECWSSQSSVITIVQVEEGTHSSVK